MTTLHGFVSSGISATAGCRQSLADRIAGVLLAGSTAMLCWGMLWFAGEFKKVCDDLDFFSSTAWYLKAIAFASMLLSITYAAAWLCQPSSSIAKIVGVGLGLAVVVMAVSAASCYLCVLDLVRAFNDPVVAMAEQADAEIGRAHV